ncbi:MAG: dTDP-4-dehydrorhamnose 3,5-epimerase [Planctomycetia bacterium]|nr:dTDP-4-dehydrorhamnose 3,5-epimerase [Planctomycetia bacterium]
MNVIETDLPGVVIIEPRVFRDPRGYFLETWNQARYGAAGFPTGMVQDNVSYSAGGVLRGLHLQSPSSQAKLIAVLAGEVFDVAVDVRVGSPTFGRWAGALLSPENHRQLFIPAGFAHGFVVTGGGASVSYKCDAYYAPNDELTVLWNDPELGIDWPVHDPILSAKDQGGRPLREIPEARLPRYTG